MKNLFFIFLMLVYSKGFCQVIDTYQKYKDYQNQNLNRIIELQKKESKNDADRFAIIEYYENSSEILENLLSQDSPQSAEITKELLDNYTYCMRAYPDKKDSVKIIEYYNRAKTLGLCKPEHIVFRIELSNSDIFPYIKNDFCVKNSWDDNSFSTPFKEDISDQEKTAGLSKLWSEAKYNFVYFDQVPDLNWDSLYFAFIPKVLATSSTKEYYDILKIFYSKLEDSHSGVFYPDQLNIGRPPLRCRMIENKVLVSNVLNDSLASIGIKKGLEVVKINGLPVMDYANKYVIPYISSSTKQDLLVRTYKYELFAGNRTEMLQIGMIDSKGKYHEYTISRKLPYNIHSKNDKTIDFKLLDNNIGYLAINSFSGKKPVIKEFDKIFNQILPTEGLIIDIRNNGGGNSGNGDYIFSCFIDKPANKWSSQTLDYRPAERVWRTGIPSWYQYEKSLLNPNKIKYYSKQVVILINANTFSAAEDFCILFDINQRAEIIGQPTAGSTGQPLLFNLPGGGWARVCTLRSYYPDGNEFVGYGIQPDIYINETISDFQNDKDIVLIKAEEYMKKKIKE
ncbi:MAG: S41 family peptidase [Bacteroidales bacterium]